MGFCKLLPTRSIADLALAGLLTPEPPLPSLLVATATMARESGKALSLSYSGGDRPGFSPGSLFVSPSSGSDRPPAHVQDADYPARGRACQADAEFKASMGQAHPASMSWVPLWPKSCRCANDAPVCWRAPPDPNRPNDIRLRIRPPQSYDFFCSSVSISLTSPGSSGLVRGSKRATTSPLRPMMNFSKFQLIFPSPLGLVSKEVRCL